MDSFLAIRCFVQGAFGTISSQRAARRVTDWRAWIGRIDQR